ncbi:MAG TPA: alkaline phosphatase family protein [Lacunisphaera sp.]|nr:alkaline phosphatase family protein [Lacunisphaera sp.]
MSLNNIENIVVLVMENRAFGHLLGYRFDGHAHGATKLASSRFTPGPEHTYRHVAKQLAVKDGVPTMSGFTADYATVDGVTIPEMVLGYYDQEIVRTYDYFADNYLVCNRWFCAVPGPTMPNRCFLLAGHSDGIVENSHMLFHLVSQGMPTLFDLLSAQGVQWRSYYHDAPFLWLFKQHLLKKDNIRPIREFYSDAAQGKLKSVTWLDPNFTLQGALHLPLDPIMPGEPTLPDAANDDHPPADIVRGQRLAFSIYKALRASPQWDNTLLILTYDEHGGFYDSCPPPLHPERAPKGNTAFDRFGVRVPAFLISRWVSRGATTHTSGTGPGVDYEHTSIARTIVDRFCPTANTDHLLERFKHAASLGPLLQDVPLSREAPPKLAFPAYANERLAVGGFSRMPRQLGAIEQPGQFHSIMSGLTALASGKNVGGRHHQTNG